MGTAPTTSCPLEHLCGLSSSSRFLCSSRRTLWFVLWWFIILWGYLTIYERRIFFVFISLILMSSWIAHVGAGFLTYAQANVNREIFCVDHSVETPGDIAVITDWVRKNQADAEPMNILALSEIQKRKHDSAVSLLTRGLDLSPNNSRYYNHLGIALAGLGKNNEAIKAFHNATALDPDNITYHYNLSRIYQATFNLYEADRSMQKASSINPEKVRSLLNQEEKSKKKRFLPEHVPLLDQITRQMKPSAYLSTSANGLWELVFGLFQRNRAIYISFAAILAVFLLGHIPEEKFTKRCNRCGNLYYAGTTSKSGYPMCLQCHWIDTKPKKQMMNSILSSKAEEIKSYRVENAAHSLKLELILPGMGSFVVNKPLNAVLRVATFSAALIMIITGCGFLQSFIATGIDYTNHIRISGFVLAALLYLRAYKSPPLKYGV
jgi:tetratricopeptide (TPR) repeat protein